MNTYKKDLVKKGIKRITEEEYNGYEEAYEEIIEETLTKYYEENPKISRKYVPDYIKTMERMKVYKEEHLRFLKYFEVPFDNNKAELQMRPTKTKKKVAGQSYSVETTNHYCAIHTINQTCILQKKNTLQTIEDILNNKNVFILC